MENQEQNNQGDLEQTEQGQGSSAQQGGQGIERGAYKSRKPDNDGHQQRDSLPADSEDLPETEKDDENNIKNKDDDDFGVTTHETA